jgi:hypothetical protein
MRALIPALLLLGCASAEGESKSPVARGPGGPLVLELFTSQGCSSCPPADRYLATLAKDPDLAPLSFHVDYWNDLGWRDPFSDPEYSARQRDYARALGSHRVYTPQLVVNGATHLVGSREATVRALVARALRGTSRARVEVSMRVDGEQVVSRHRAHGAPAGSAVTLVLARRTALRHVTRGENAGRTLRHVDVVAQVQRRGLAGDTRWRLPDGVPPNELEVTALLQDPQTMRIHGAARAKP